MICPITQDTVVHLCRLHGRFPFETDAILTWLKQHSLTNPYTNEPVLPDWAHNLLTPADEEAAQLIRKAGFLTGGLVRELICNDLFRRN
jgi:hypothetical protein